MKHASQWALLSAAVVVGIAYSCATPVEVAGCAPGALRATRALTRRASREAVLEAMRIEGEAFAERLRSPEAMEAFQAFLNRRPADFSRF